MTRFMDLTGHCYGYLRVKSYVGKKGKFNYWECKCRCGKVTEVSIQNLRGGTVKSCGCGKREGKLAEKNPMWKGDKVGYIGLHEWVRRRKKKPSFCESCKKKPALDLANVSQKYKRDLDDWKWLCRGCHVRGDGRINNLRNSYAI